MNPGDTKDFEVHIKNECNEILSATPSSLANQQYTVARPTISPSFDSFAVVPASCELSYLFTVSPELVAPDNTAIQFDSYTRTFTI